MHEKSLRHLSQHDPVLARVIKWAKLKPLKPRNDHFKSLVVFIISQQLSTKAANTIEARFVTLFGGKFPKAGEVLKVSDKQLRACGLSLRKISYIKHLARSVEQKKINFKKLKKATDEEVINILMQLKGIGRWTAEMFLIFSLARPDVFSVGDLGLRNAIKKLYKIDAVRHKRKLVKLVDSWKPYRTAAARHLWASLELKK